MKLKVFALCSILALNLLGQDSVNESLVREDNNIIKETDNNKKTNNEVDDNYDVEKGWDFYDDKASTKSSAQKALDKIKKGSIIKLLREIKDENKKQTKIQTEILSIIKEAFDPQPKEIIKNGKKCIANSSGECFDYDSLMIAEAKKVPAMKEFLADPYDLNKAANYLQWQAKLFNHSFNIGNSMQFAVEQWGDKAYPMATNRPTYDIASGVYDAKILPKAKAKYINSLKADIETHIFLGKNISLDIFSLSSIADTLKKYNQLTFKFHFIDKKSKLLFEDGMQTLYGTKNQNWNMSSKVIDKKSFTAFGIITTPSAVVKYTGKKEVKNKVQTIIAGRISQATFSQRILNYLEFNKIIDYKKMSDFRIWEENSGNFTKDYYANTYHIKMKTDTNESNTNYNQKREKNVSK